MVVKMRSGKSKASSGTSNGLDHNLRLPVFDQPLVERWPMKISWENAVRSFASSRDHYMQHFDSAEQRARDKNPQRFSLG